MKYCMMSLFTVFFLSGCAQSVGVGIGGVMADGNSIATSEVHLNSETGIHGSVAMGADFNL